MKPGMDKRRYSNIESDTDAVSDQDVQDVFSEQDSSTSFDNRNVYQRPKGKKYAQMESYVVESETEVSDQDYDVVPYSETIKEPYDHRHYDQYHEHSEPDSSGSSDYDDEHNVYLSSDAYVVNSSIQDSQGNGKKKKLKGIGKHPPETPGTKRCKFLDYMKKKTPANYNEKDGASGEENSEEDESKRIPHWYLVGRDGKRGEGMSGKGGLALVVKKKI